MRGAIFRETYLHDSSEEDKTYQKENQTNLIQNVKMIPKLHASTTCQLVNSMTGPICLASVKGNPFVPQMNKYMFTTPPYDTYHGLKGVLNLLPSSNIIELN